MDEVKQPVIDLGQTILNAPKEDASNFQLNPSSAIARNTSSEERVKERQIITALVGMIAVVAVIAVGQRFIQMKRLPVNVEAAVNMKHAMRATVGRVDAKNEMFTAWYEESLDSRIQLTNAMEWSVRLPPGTSFEGSDTTQLQSCYTVPDIRKGLGEAKPMPCKTVVVPGQQVLVEYAVLQPESVSMVAKTIIGNNQ